MSQCPHCQAEFEQGQRYCKVCGSYLLHPETGDNFCPQCGIRVSQRQEFCHECDAPLKGEGAPAPAPQEPSPAPPPPPPAAAAPATVAPPWLIGLLIGAGVIIVLLVILLFIRTSGPPPATPPPAPKAEAPAPPSPAPAPAPTVPAPAPPPPPAPAPEASTPETQAPDLKGQLQIVLSNMREARLTKNIIQLMNCYSLTYPDLEGKRREALKAWEIYDYTNMVFTIDEMQPLDADNANAKVTWYVDLKEPAHRGINQLHANLSGAFCQGIRAVAHPLPGRNRVRRSK